MSQLLSESRRCRWFPLVLFLLLHISQVHGYTCMNYQTSCGTFTNRWCCSASETCGTYYSSCKRSTTATTTTLAVSLTVFGIIIVCVCAACCSHLKNHNRRVTNSNPVRRVNQQRDAVWSVSNDDILRPPRPSGHVFEVAPPSYEDAVIELATKQEPAPLPAAITETSRF